MKTILLLFLFCSFSLAEIGWKGNTITVEGVAYTDVSVEITADDQVLTVGSTTLFKVSSDSNISNQRTVLLSKPDKNNHLLILKYEDEANDRIELSDGSAVSGGSGVLKLSMGWNPNAGDTLTLMYSEPDYLELARSTN